MISIVAIPPVNRSLVTNATTDLALVFPETIRSHGNIDVHADMVFDPSRKQFNASRLLAIVLDQTAGIEGKILAVTGVDLFIPVLTYVIGEAQLNGRASVMSTYRLHEELYGLPADPHLLRKRVLKEAVHELGHTFGLIHCRDPLCVMRPSAAVEEIDIKGISFCEECRSQRMANGA